MDEINIIRLKSFGYSLATYVGGVLLTALASPEFQDIITEHFGGTLIGVLIITALPEIVKHVRNTLLTEKLGASSKKVQLF